MTKTSLRPRLLSLAPLVFLAHVVEEAPGLIAWMNGRFELDLTMWYFVAMNAIGLLVTVVVAAPSVRSRNYFRALGVIAWLSFLMLANGVLHLTASSSLPQVRPRNRHRWDSLPALLRCRHRRDLPQC